MSFIQPEPPRIPPEVPDQRHDDDQWREPDQPRGRMPVSTTQILLGFVLLIIVVSIAAFCLTSSDSEGLDAEIVSPEAGTEYPAGPIFVRIRATAGDGQIAWQLAYRPVDGDWTLLADGDTPVFPRNIAGQGTEVLELNEPGDYEIRLTAEDRSTEEQVIKTVQITVTP